ncbi:The fantastic four family [Spatholobus suberectus]|nr:The fantastic four family [Spatholobus suberectus]
MITSSITFPPNGDDYIGTESCVDLQGPNDVVDSHETSKSNDAKHEAKAKSNTKKKQNKVFPPPIPLLARTLNLASHMPWVLKRYYTSEGRLILKEEKVKHHEYFRAHRANGRLTLQLVHVPLDDYDEYFEEAAPTSPHEEVDHVDNVTHDHAGVSGNDRFEDEDNVASVAADELSVERVDDDVVVAGSGRVKCLNCNSVRSGPASIFGVPVHPIRTVHG